MDSIKSIYNNMSDMSKTLIKILLGILAGLAAILVIVLIVKVTVGTKGDYSYVEDVMKKAAVDYYEDNSKDLPADGQTVSIEVGQLVADEYMKSLTKYFGEDTTCNGEVNVVNNNDNYAYLPNLDCPGKYTTKTLYNAILENNSDAVDSDGLYLNDDGDYIFKGEYVNNHLVFGENNYRILRINSDGTIRILITVPLKNYRRSVYDDRYNVQKEDSSGINDFAKSRIREELDKIYNDNDEFNSDERALIMKQDLCIGKRGEEDIAIESDIECSDVYEGQYLGLMSASEYNLPSLDSNCKNITDESCLNYNYMMSIDGDFWSSTPVKENSYEVYRVSALPYPSRAASSANVLFTINLSDMTQITGGNGSEEEPFIVKLPDSK